MHNKASISIFQQYCYKCRNIRIEVESRHSRLRALGLKSLNLAASVRLLRWYALPALSWFTSLRLKHFLHYHLFRPFTFTQQKTQLSPCLDNCVFIIFYLNILFSCFILVPPFDDSYISPKDWITSCKIFSCSLERLLVRFVGAIYSRLSSFKISTWNLLSPPTEIESGFSSPTNSSKGDIKQGNHADQNIQRDRMRLAFISADCRDTLVEPACKFFLRPSSLFS